MKQPGYTAGVTSVYRKYLDILFEKGAENYRVAEEDKRYLLDLFNRGGSCTGYYQMQNGPSMMAFSNEKKTGDVSPVLRKKKEKIQGTFILFPGSPAILDVSCRGIHGFASVGEVQYAQNQPLTEERIRSQMEKLGNTEYEWENLEIQMDENIFKHFCIGYFCFQFHSGHGDFIQFGPLKINLSLRNTGFAVCACSDTQCFITFFYIMIDTVKIGIFFLNLCCLLKSLICQKFQGFLKIL